MLKGRMMFLFKIHSFIMRENREGQSTGLNLQCQACTLGLWHAELSPWYMVMCLEYTKIK